MQSEDSDVPGSSSLPTEDATKKLTRKRSNPSSRSVKKRTKVAKTSSDLDSENQSNDCDSDDSTAVDDEQHHTSNVPNQPVDLSSLSHNQAVAGAAQSSNFHI